ncbi:hypothetical protein ACA910_019791 [Epithemia clementina (nom. ined.)]
MAIDQSVNRPLHQEEKETKQAFSGTRAKKRVRIDESQNQQHVIHKRAFADMRETWYTNEEYELMRSRFYKAILDFKKRSSHQDEMSYSNILRALFELVASVEYIVDDPKSILNDDIQRKLALLYTQEEMSIELIGLESYVVSRVRREARERRDAVQEVVFDVQNEYNAGLLDDDDFSNELRDSCLNFSQACGLFAQLQAQVRLIS